MRVTCQQLIGADFRPPCRVLPNAIKKAYKGEGGGGHEHPTALGLCVFWVFEGDGKDNLTRKRRKGWKVKEVYNRNLKTFPSEFFLEWKDV